MFPHTESQFAMRLNRTFLSLSALVVAVALVSSIGSAADEKKKGKKKGRRANVGNLDNPTGIAIQPGTGIVFIASHDGITRLDPKTGESHLEIARSSTGVYGKGPMYNISPLGLAFLDKDHLVVGGGGRPDGEELVHIYKIAAETGKKHKAYKEGSAVQTLGPIKPEEDVTTKGEGNFYGVAVGAGGIFVTCNGDDTKGWVAKATITDGKPGKLTPSIATKEATEVDAPVAITFSLNGKDLVVGQMGEMNVANDGLLTIYDPTSGKMKASYETGLSDICGLAYSPKTGKLYATDFSWVDSTKGGLFELTIKGDEVTAKLVRKLDKPTAIAFDDAGNLYVALFGTAKEGSKRKSGRVIRIKAGL
jgi:DNA-binding beta-propeller fold protein YncE